MIKTNLSKVEAIDRIKCLSNSKVNVKVNLGRNKYVSFNGKITAIYPALFTVTPFDKNYRGKTSYSYQEYMCGKVILSLIQ